MRYAAALLLLLAIQGCSAPKDHQVVKPIEVSIVDRNFIAAVNGAFGMETVYAPVTVVDGTTNVRKSGCVTVNGLLGAIHRERGIDYDERSMENVRQIALAAPHREFVFTKPNALANVGFKHLGANLLEECALVREGWKVWKPDFGPLSTSKPGYQVQAHLQLY